MRHKQTSQHSYKGNRKHAGAR